MTEAIRTTSVTSSSPVALAIAAPRWIRFGLWLSMFAIFVASPVVYLSDSDYSMLTAESLLHHGTPDLSFYKIPHFESDLPFNAIRGHHAYQLQRANGHLLYGFPHGTPILSAPLVGLLGLFGISASTPNNRFDLFGEVVLQKLIAAALMATFVVVSFHMATLLLSWKSSLIVAIGTGLGTQVWSTASRGMWAHTWEITLAVLVVYLLLRAEVRSVSSRPALLSTLLAWMYFVRPTGAIAALFVATYVLVFRRDEFTTLTLVGIGWLLAFTAYTLSVFGTVIPFYYGSQIWSFRTLPIGVYGDLFSPSRGLFVLSPLFAVVAYWLIRWRRNLRFRPLVFISLLIITATLFSVAAHMDWWGGACYGARYMTDTLPWLVLLSILGFAAIPPECRSLRSPSISVAAIAVVLSMMLNGIGAVSWATERWNYTGPYPAAMLDWSRPQFLAPWMGY